MKKVIKEYIPSKYEYYSDLSNKKISLFVGNETIDEPSHISLKIPTEGYEESGYDDGEYCLVKIYEEIDLDLTTSEAVSLLKYLRKKYPKNKNLKTEFWVK